MSRKTNIAFFSLIAALLAGPAYSVTVSKTYVDKQDKALHNNTLKVIEMLNVKEDGAYVELDTEATAAIPAINELHSEMAGKQDAITAENPLPVGNISGLAEVATTGSYNSLSDKPEIPSTDNLATKDELQALQTVVGDEESGLVKQVTANTANIALKANSEDVYAKNEVYTKSEVNTALEGKQNELTAENVVSGSDNITVGFADGVYTISAKNTEYGVGTATTEGLTKLYTATGEAQDGTMTQAAIKVALDGKLATNGTAAMATADANGANIADTYATKEVVAGKLSSIKTAGSYLVNFGTDGKVSYAPIQILGSNGQPITLTGENAVAPSAN